MSYRTLKIRVIQDRGIARATQRNTENNKQNNDDDDEEEEAEEGL